MSDTWRLGRRIVGRFQSFGRLSITGREVTFVNGIFSREREEDAKDTGQRTEREFARYRCKQGNLPLDKAASPDEIPIKLSLILRRLAD